MSHVLTHQYMVPIDPPGTDGRRWRCVDCGRVGTIGYINAVKCPNQPRGSK